MEGGRNRWPSRGCRKNDMLPNVNPMAKAHPCKTIREIRRVSVLRLFRLNEMCVHNQSVYYVVVYFRYFINMGSIRLPCNILGRFSHRPRSVNHCLALASHVYIITDVMLSQAFRNYYVPPLGGSSSYHLVKQLITTLITSSSS